MMIAKGLTAGRLWAGILALGSVLAPGCDHGAICDPGQVLSDNQCISAPASGGSTSGGAPALGGFGGMDGALGVACTEANGTVICGEDLSCAIQPGMMEGYCTVMGCSSMSTPCPPAYSCFALADACLKQ